MKDILVSIITPTYNSKLSFLMEAYCSLLNQTYKNWEWCIVDDCSSNTESFDFLESIKSKDHIHVEFLHEKSGIAKATNTAVEMASGQILIFLDHDDYLNDKAIQRIISVYKEKNSDIIYTDEAVVRDGKILNPPHLKPDFSPHTLLSINYICHLLAVRKDIYLEIGGLRENVEGVQDHDLLLRLIKKTEKIDHIPEVLYYWRLHDNSLTRNNPDLIFSRGCKIIKEKLSDCNYNSVVIPSDYKYVYYPKIEIKNEPSVSIVILKSDEENNIDKCVQRIEKSSYKKYNISIVSKQGVLYIKNVLEDQNNDFICIIKDNIIINNSDWMEWFIGYCQDPCIGIVSGKILTKDNKIKFIGDYYSAYKKVLKYLIDKEDIKGVYWNKSQYIQDVEIIYKDWMFFKKSSYDLIGFEDTPEFDKFFSIQLCSRKFYNLVLPNIIGVSL